MREEIILKKIISIIIIFLFIAGNATIAIAEDEVTKKVIFDAENGINTFYIDEDYTPDTTGYGIYCFNKIQDGINKSNKNTKRIIVHRGSYDEDIIVNKTVEIIAGIETPTNDEDEDVDVPVNIEKTCNKIVAKFGDTVTYTIKVNNTGNEFIGTLKLISIEDSIVDLSTIVGLKEWFDEIEVNHEKSFKYNYTIEDNDPHVSDNKLTNIVEVHYHPKNLSDYDVSDIDTYTIDITSLGYYTAEITGNISIINESVKISSDGNIKFNITGKYFNISSEEISIDNVNIYPEFLNLNNNNIYISNSTFNLGSGLFSLEGKNNLEFYNNSFLTKVEILFCEGISINECDYILDSSYNGKTQLFITSSEYLNIQNCSFTGDNLSIGMEILSSINSVFKYNDFTDSYSNYVLLLSSCIYCDVNNNVYTHLSRNINNRPESVIFLEYSNYMNIAHNNIITEDTYHISDHYIRLKYANNNTIHHNELYGPFSGMQSDDTPSIEGELGYGIRLVSSNANRIYKNNINGLKLGLGISQSKGNLIANNIIEDCRQAGLYLASNIYDAIFFNNLTNNYISIVVKATNYEYIKFNNIITSNQAEGLYVKCYTTGQGSLIFCNYNYWGDQWGPWFRVGVFLPQILFFPWCINYIEESPLAEQIGWPIFNSSAIFSPLHEEIQLIDYEIPWE